MSARRFANDNRRSWGGIALGIVLALTPMLALAFMVFAPFVPMPWSPR